MGEIKWERTAAILITLTLGGALLWGILRVAFPILLPFLLAWLIAMPLRPLSETLHRRTHLPRALWAILLLALAVGLGAGGIAIAVERLISETGRLVERLLSDGGVMDGLERMMLWLEEVSADIPFLNRGETNARDEVYTMITGMLSGFLNSISAGLPSLAAALLSSLPSIFFSILLTFIAGFYFCVDGARIRDALTSLLPARVEHAWAYCSERVRTLFGRYVKAYLQLLTLTFGMLLAGFLILRVEYAFLLALLIAVLDLLPVIGVGTVMVPWSLLLLLQKNFYLGFGILILYLIVELIRQVAEPRLVGKSLGLHPLLTLFATYVGFSLFGILGMILGPIAALGVKLLLGSVRTEKQKPSA